jgi:hypothetical protein
VILLDNQSGAKEQARGPTGRPQRRGRRLSIPHRIVVFPINAPLVQQISTRIMPPIAEDRFSAVLEDRQQFSVAPKIHFTRNANSRT